MRTTKIRVTFIGLAAAASLTLAACGSDSSSEETASASPAATSAAATASESPSAMASDEASTSDIVGVASANPTTTTLVTALDAAGLVEALQAPGPFTVFAPTDDAFAALPEGVLDKLVQPANKDALTKILTYHVVEGAVPSSEVTDGDVPTLEGQSITLSTAGGGVTVNGATVTTPDVEASNGVIHLIDQVLLPPDFDPATLQ
ncbi:MAG: fasciclin domain-containing protein [Actinobacteria bacterium]|nr:fasciclin domain-containing protein [Actinomycetota bacterium]